MNFILNPAYSLIAGFLIILLILFIPFMPAVLAFSNNGGDGQYLDHPPAGSQFSIAGGNIIPNGEYLFPVSGVSRYTSGYGMRFHPKLNKWRMHYGIDIGASEGRNIMAMDDGTIIFVGNKGGYGKTVIIDHGNGITSLYAHCSKYVVKNNQYVSAGEVIAKVGNTGLSTGPHLHLEIRFDDIPVDPLPYISGGR